MISVRGRILELLHIWFPSIPTHYTAHLYCKSLIYSISLLTWMHGLLVKLIYIKLSPSARFCLRRLHQTPWRGAKASMWKTAASSEPGCECVIQPLHCCSCSSCGDIISPWPSRSPFICILLDWMTATQSSIVPEPVMSVHGGVTEVGPASDHSVLLQHHVRGFAVWTAGYLWGTFHPFTFCGPVNSNSGQRHTVHIYTHTQQHSRVSKQLDVHVSFDSGMKLENLRSMWNMWNIWNMHMSEQNRQRKC